MKKYNKIRDKKVKRYIYIINSKKIPRQEGVFYSKMSRFHVKSCMWKT